jgi:hypothetical protein
VATILYAWELGGGLGHLLRSLPLARKLAGRGHRVIAALRELRRAGVMVDRHSATEPPRSGGLLSGAPEVQVLPAPYLAWRIADPIEPVRTYADLLHNVGFAHVEDLRILTRAWQTIFALARPDVVLCDHSPTALLAASLDGIPTATIGTGFCCPPCDGESLPDLRPWLTKQGSGVGGQGSGTLAPSLATGGPPRSGGLLSEVGGRTEDCVLANINAIRAEAGKTPWERLAGLYSSAAETFLTTFAELDHFAAERGGESGSVTPGREDASSRRSVRNILGTYLGMWESDQGVRFTWPSGRGPRVFFYTHRFPARDWLLDELRRRGLPTVAYSHDLPRELADKLAGPTMFASPSPLNISQAAAECDIAILNSGHNSSAQFLLSGKALLLLPIALEQGLLMRRLTSQGLAVSAPPDRPPAIAAALDELLTRTCYRDAARAFAAKYVSYDPEAVQNYIVAAVIAATTASALVRSEA